MQEFLNQSYFGNTLLNYAIALGSFLAVAIIIIIINNVPYAIIKSFSTRFKSTAFVATIIEDILIRRAANSGRSIIPKLG